MLLHSIAYDGVISACHCTALPWLFEPHLHTHSPFLFIHISYDWLIIIILFFPFLFPNLWPTHTNSFPHTQTEFEDYDLLWTTEDIGNKFLLLYSALLLSKSKSSPQSNPRAPSSSSPQVPSISMISRWSIREFLKSLNIKRDRPLHCSTSSIIKTWPWGLFSMI